MKPVYLPIYQGKQLCYIINIWNTQKNNSQSLSFMSSTQGEERLSYTIKTGYWDKGWQSGSLFSWFWYKLKNYKASHSLHLRWKRRRTAWTTQYRPGDWEERIFLLRPQLSYTKIRGRRGTDLVSFWWLINCYTKALSVTFLCFPLVFFEVDWKL